MYSPRRIMFVVVGLVFCLGLYFAYAQILGRVDGLPPLPERFSLVADVNSLPMPTNQISPVREKLEQAFGLGCLELDYKWQFEIGAKGTVLATNLERFTEDGRMVLSPMSVAVFGKSKTGSSGQEVNTIHCDRGILTYNKPVFSFNDLTGSYITKVDFLSDPEIPFKDPRKGRIKIVNIRPKAIPREHLEIYTVGPMYFVDASDENPEPLVSTDAMLEMYDWENNLKAGIGPQNARFPTMVARGMRMYLKEDKPETAKGKKPEKRTGASKIAGVDRVDLLAEVTMNLWSDSQSDFLSGGATQPGPPKPAVPNPAAAPAEPPALVTVETQGPFHYDMNKDMALFESVPSINPNLPNHVKATRKGKNQNLDILLSDYLELQFKRVKETAPAPATFAQGPAAPIPPPPAPGDAPESTTLQIERAHAWGNAIALTSDSEKLNANGNDLVYEAEKRTTLLKGNPKDAVYAVKDGNVIQCRDLLLISADKPDPKADPKTQTSSGNGIREARARGPGRVGMGDLDPVTRKHVQEAVFEDWLFFNKVDEGGKNFQIVKLLGHASFRDYKSNQILRGEQIRVWFNDNERDGLHTAVAAVEQKVPPDSAVASQPKPIRLESVRNVSLDSPQIILKEADLLNVYFRDLPVVAPPPAANANPVNPLPGPAANPPGTQPAPAGPNGAPLPPGQPPPPEKKDEPIYIRAARMDAWVLRKGNAHELEKTICTVNVRVFQAAPPDRKNDRGTQMFAHILELEHFPGGPDNLHKLTLKAESPAIAAIKPAELHTEDLSLSGTVIVIDERDNHANVSGAGGMRMKSAAGLTGQPTAPAANPPPGAQQANKDSNIFIYWKDSMEFDGTAKWAKYIGSVQAETEDETQRILCEIMDVTLDRVVIFKKSANRDKPPPGKEDEQAKIDRINCTRGEVKPGQNVPPVYAIEKRIEKDKLVKYQRLEANELQYENKLPDPMQTPPKPLMVNGQAPPPAKPMGNTNSQGPGIVRIFQPKGDDSPDQGAGQPPKPKPPVDPAKADDPPMMLTWVDYTGRMQTKGDDWVKFLDETTVIRVPATDPEMKIEKGALLPESIEMHCHKSLTVSTVEVDPKSAKNADPKAPPKKATRLEGEGNVRVLGPDFESHSEQVKYDETKNLLTFIGTKSNPATLEQFEGAARTTKMQRAERITYNVVTKATSFEGGVGSQFSK